MDNELEYIIIIINGEKIRVNNPKYGEIKLIIHQGELRIIETIEKRRKNIVKKEKGG